MPINSLEVCFSELQNKVSLLKRTHYSASSFAACYPNAACLDYSFIIKSLILADYQTNRL